MKKNLSSFFKAMALFFALSFMVSCKNEVNQIEVDNQFAIQLFTDTVRISDILTMVDSTTLEYFQIKEGGEISIYFSDTINNAITAEDILSGNTEFVFATTEEFNVNFPNLSGELDISKPELIFSYINTFDFEATGIIDSVFLTNASENEISLIKDWSVIERPLPPTANTSVELADIEDYIVDEVSLMDEYKTVTFSGDIIVDGNNIDYNTVSDDDHIDFISEIILPLDFVIEDLVFNDVYDFSINTENDEDSENINIDGNFDELEFKFVCVNTLPIQVKPQLYILQNDSVIDSMFVDDSYIHAGTPENPTEDVIIVNIVDEKLERIRQADQVVLNVVLSSLGNNVVINANDYFFLRVGLTTKTSEISID